MIHPFIESVVIVLCMDRNEGKLLMNNQSSSPSPCHPVFKRVSLRKEQPVKSYALALFSFVVWLCVAIPSSGEVMLQWFETEWDEMYRRLPEVAEIGYDYLWVPSPCKAPTGTGTKWGNVGYNLYDRFDLGDIPQRGSLATRYGTRGSMRNMVDKAHQCDIKIIPDIIMNHNGNGPDFREYPGMVTEDFHVQWESNHVPGLNYKRGPRMNQWHHGEGYGGTLWQELVSLIDIRTEDHPSRTEQQATRFTGGNNTPGWDLVGSRPSFLRHPGQYDKYPCYPAGYGNEKASEMLYRWIAWLGNEMDYDGLRLDAGKHVEWEFFGSYGWGFLHEAQHGYNLRRNYSDDPADEADELFTNYLAERDDALIFAEILSPWSEIEYWSAGRTRNPMRFLDYAIKKTADSALSGSIGNFHGYGKDFGPENGITYIWGHDEGPASKVDLGYAYILTHIGFPMVYFTGKNITWADHNVRTWMRPGYDSRALADDGGEIENLVWIHQQFVRGGERDLWHDDDYLALERVDDSASSNKGLLISAMNDSGWDLQKDLYTSFAEDMILHDYTGHFVEDWGHGVGNIRVEADGKATVKVPGNSGQGWVCFAPLIPEELSIEFLEGGTTPAPTMDWEVPRGENGSAYVKQIPRITDTNLTVKFTFTPPSGGSVSSCMLKWGQGRNLTTNDYDAGRGVVSGLYEKMQVVSVTEQHLPITITADNIPEGLNVVKCRAFVDRSGTEPALFSTETKVVYIDRRGPEVDVVHPAQSATLYGDAVMDIANPDYTAFGMTVALDGNAPTTAHKIMPGTWKYALRDLSTGTHTALVSTTEATYGTGDTRPLINTSTYTRVFNVISNANVIGISHGHGHQQELPFFSTTVTAPGSPDLVRLYWDGYELPFNGGGLTNIFNGAVIYRYDSIPLGNELWGNFCNGQHFFEAIRVDGGVTNRSVKRVNFNLYGINAIDSDGDSIPDNVEMPFIDSDGAPGADAPWPGDDNKDFVPNYGENWTRLNPYNHSTFYSGVWDDAQDFDGDGYSNGEEVMHGYYEGNIHAYDIYDAVSTPTGTLTVASTAVGVPDPAQRGETLLITYTPNEGPLSNAVPVHVHIGHSARSNPEWQNVTNYLMAGSAGGPWTTSYMVPSNATSVDFVFRNAAGDLWDNNNANDWRIDVQSDTNRYWTMDGAVDSEDYKVWDSDMHIWAAHKGENLYVATWGTQDAPGDDTKSDHFVYVTDELGTASGLAPDWNKSGSIFVDTSSKPYLAGESESGWSAWHNVVNGSSADSPAGVLEGEINLIDAFGSVPDHLYVCAVAHETYNDDDGELTSQGPHTWNNDGNIDIMEMLRVPLASIRDSDTDGHFDGGSPQMWTTVGGDTSDANYGLRRFFINELAGDTAEITIDIEPNVGAGNTLSHVELFSNINRRDFAVMYEDREAIDTTSATNYYRAYSMTEVSAGRFSKTLTIRKCGAYRINARYRVNGGGYVYYTDSGLRRDCAVVVSPTKALQLTMYEVNPMFVEATNDNFYGRSTFKDLVMVNTNKPDSVSTNHFTDLGINMIWLQPIHPIGYEGRETDQLTGLPYDPGSPYAVYDYWQVNSVLGDPSTPTNAMAEFVGFVQAMDDSGVGVMLDGTFNHSAWDCQIGQMGVEMGITTNPTEKIRAVRPQWYSRKDHYGEQATHYEHGGAHDLAVAPDRFDFGKWADAADFHFGTYDTLVQNAPADTNNWWPSPWARRFLLEEDRFDGHNSHTRELWDYFTAYPIYWLEKTGHPAGTPPEQSHKGIDGLRCDFAQGLPSHFWEYCINTTRSVKWDFLFMAESLDGYNEVAGSKRHGVGYRSSRHFDILNENLVFYWRNNFFNYFDRPNAVPETYPTQQAIDARRVAYDNSPLLLNLTSHDEVYPAHDPYRVFYAYCELAAIDGVPMVFYGQEAGAQNDHNIDPWIADDAHNFEHYEENFGKSIPNFKRYNHMSNIWTNRDTTLETLYGRVNAARLSSPALISQEQFFLSDMGGDYDPAIFAVAKYEEAGVSAATQDLVFAVVNNNYWDPAHGQPGANGTNVSATFNVNTNYAGKNWFGIDSTHEYNIVNLLSETPQAELWGTNKTGANLLTMGLDVSLHEDPLTGQHAQYLKLVDKSDSGPGDNDNDGLNDWQDPDDDNDGLPDGWEVAHGLSPTNAAGIHGALGDKDGDGMSNRDELAAGTNPDDADDKLAVRIRNSSGTMQAEWGAKLDKDYWLLYTDNLMPPMWMPLSDRKTALTTNQTVIDYGADSETTRFYRVVVE